MPPNSMEIYIPIFTLKNLQSLGVYTIIRQAFSSFFFGGVRGSILEILKTLVVALSLMCH